MLVTRAMENYLLDYLVRSLLRVICERGGYVWVNIKRYFIRKYIYDKKSFGSN